MAYEFTPTPARQPTEEEWATEVDEAQKAHEELAAAVLVGREAMWKMAEACWRVNECHGWLKLGYDTQGEYLAQPEIHMSRRTFQRFHYVWNATVVTRHLDAPTLAHLDVTKVDIVLPAVTTAKVSIEDALSDAQVLGAHDLRDKYQGIPSPADPPPPGENGAEPEDDEMRATIAVDEAIEAMDDAVEELREAYASGVAQPRLPRDVLGWVLFDLRTRPARVPDLIANELTETNDDDGEK